MNIFLPDDVITTKKSPVTLLTLPRNELQSQPPQGNITATSSSSSSSFVLLQVPLNFTVDDFINHTTNSTTTTTTPHPNMYFVATQHNKRDTNHPQQPQDAVSCVVESKGCSFTVHRIETSNTLILVPPPPSTSPISGTECTHADSTIMMMDDTKDAPESSQHKKFKSTNPSSCQLTRVLSAHLVQTPNVTNDGNCSDGSYFLELRRKQLQLSDLRRALVVLDPYNNITPYNNNNNDKNNKIDDITRIGRTIHDLATSLQVSQMEIRQGLQHIGAYALPSNMNQQYDYYCLLAEHIMNDCYDAIVTGLYTMSDCTDDYGGTNGIIHIDQLTFIKNIVHHVQGTDNETIPNIEAIFLHCLQLLQKDPLSTNGTFVLDVGKVAVCIVRRLFLKRTEPFQEKELFTMWQSELPGVGSIYQVSRRMLRGVAICTGDSHLDNDDDDEKNNTDHGYQPSSASSERQWHYLPVESMSMDAQKCFDVLFQCKDRYTMDELEPYLQHLIDTLPSKDTDKNSNNHKSSSSSSVTELLLRYTKLITKVGRDGATRMFYEKR